MQGRAERTQFCEANNVREKDGHGLKMFWFHGSAIDELLYNEAEIRELGNLIVSLATSLL